MKKQQPIYVQIDIDTTMDKLWEYTQNPDLHTAWDARFTEISYLPRAGDEPQRFLYRTRIGMRLDIAGEGESAGQVEKESGDRVSSLKFWTQDRLSLIRKGSGYWKYTSKDECIGFETLYQYESAFGTAGRLVDAYLFRPLLGWATAWSFDALKIWLEQGFHPKLLLRRFLTYWTVCGLIAFVWLYHGLVPKVIMAHPDEIRMMEAVTGSMGHGEAMIRLVGVLEMLFGLLWLLPLYKLKRRLFILQIIAICGLTISAGVGDIASFVAPFNPVTLNVMLIVLALIGWGNSRDLPSAARCRRKKAVSL